MNYFILCSAPQVMLLRNRALGWSSSKDKQQEQPLVNGSRGRVIGYAESSEGTGLIPLVRFDNGQEVTIACHVL